MEFLNFIISYFFEDSPSQIKQIYKTKKKKKIERDATCLLENLEVEKTTHCYDKLCINFFIILSYILSRGAQTSP